MNLSNVMKNPYKVGSFEYSIFEMSYQRNGIFVLSNIEVSARGIEKLRQANKRLIKDKFLFTVYAKDLHEFVHKEFLDTENFVRSKKIPTEGNILVLITKHYYFHCHNGNKLFEDEFLENYDIWIREKAPLIHSYYTGLEF